MKQLSTQVLQYSMNYDGWMVGVTGGWCCNGGGWNSGNISGWRVDLRTGGLAVDSKNPEAKGCPSIIADAVTALGPAEADGTVSNTSAGTCYGGGIGLNFNYGVRRTAYGRKPRVRISQLYNPSKGVLMADTQASEVSFPHYVMPRVGVAGAFNGTQYTRAANQSFRHSKRSNVGWSDGHVSAEVPGELGTTDFALANNVGYLGTTDAYYCLTKADFEELGLTPGEYK